jgi:hypothetical protein
MERRRRKFMMDACGKARTNKLYEFKSSTHKKKLRGFSPQANYANRAIAAGQRS